MTTPKQDPLDTLQLMLNEVLVQTGKALRASRKDSIANLVPSPPASAQAKLPGSLSTFHSALDELENEIVHAKSVLLRDLNKLKTEKAAPAEQPQPVEAQTKEPMVIDLESSPVPSKDQSSGDAPSMAPFPNMSVDMPDMSQFGAVMGSTGNADASQSSGAPTAPMASMTTDVKDSGTSLDETAGLQSGGPYFTDMQFGVVPGNDDSQNMSGMNQGFQDLTNDDMLQLDNLLPQQFDSSNNFAASTSQDESAGGTQVKADDFSYDALNTIDSPKDGDDFDFTVGGEETFETLMNDRDDTMEGLDTMDFKGNGDAPFESGFFMLDN